MDTESLVNGERESQNTMSFEDKQKMLFESLNTAAKCIKGTTLEQKQSDAEWDRHKKPNKLAVKRFQGKESIFKRPDAPLQRCLKPRRTPDYQKNPHKWTKYSLEDVDTSDRTNTAGALAFLREIEERKAALLSDSYETEDAAEESGKILFKNRKRNHTKATFNQSVHLKNTLHEDDDPIDDKLDKPIMKGSRLVMPEYVIGREKKEVRRRSKVVDKTEPITDSKSLKLDHLFEEDGEVDD